MRKYLSAFSHSGPFFYSFKAYDRPEISAKMKLLLFLIYLRVFSFHLSALEENISINFNEELAAMLAYDSQT
jgi:hypothetical protein